MIFHNFDFFIYLGCKYTDWLPTSKCSVTCVVGVQIQTRIKYEYNGTDAEDCDKSLTKVKKCTNKPCK